MSAHPSPASPTGVGEAGSVVSSFEPILIGFTCNWCSYRAADLAGTARIKYPPNVRLIRLMCSGRLDPTFVLKAFQSGADGVIMTGCWPADCHYRIQNVKALRRFELLRRVLEELGIEPARFQRVYASAAEGQQLAEAFERIIGEVRAIGPLGWGQAGPDVLDAVAAAAQAAVEADLDEPVAPDDTPAGQTAADDLPALEEARP
jgi:F420-non-reducing hydrogenase iron-sulfur subunit